MSAMGQSSVHCQNAAGVAASLKCMACHSLAHVIAWHICCAEWFLSTHVPVFVTACCSVQQYKPASIAVQFCNAFKHKHSMPCIHLDSHMPSSCCRLMSNTHMEQHDRSLCGFHWLCDVCVETSQHGLFMPCSVMIKQFARAAEGDRIMGQT